MLDSSNVYYNPSFWKLPSSIYGCNWLCHKPYYIDSSLNQYNSKFVWLITNIYNILITFVINVVMMINTSINFNRKLYNKC